MPKLRPIAPVAAQSPQQQPRNVNASLPAEAAANLGQAAANVGTGLSDLAQKQQEVQQLTEFTKRKTDASLAADQFVRDQEANPNLDFSQPEQSQAYLDGIAKGLDKIGTDMLQGVKDPKMRAMLQDAQYTQRETAIINSRNFAHNRMTEAGRGELMRSLDADLKIGVDASGAQLDSLTNGVSARLVAAEHAQLITPVQREAKWQEWNDTLQAVRIDKETKANPDLAIADLKDDAHFGNVDPAKRQDWLDKAVNEKARQQALAQKQADDARETAVAAMESQALAGGLTHAALEDNRQKLGLKPQEYEHLYDLINKPAQESPSDTKLRNSMGIAVQLSPPQVTQEQLYKSYLDYQAGKPGLNLADFTELNTKLKEGIRSANAPDSARNQQKSLALSILDDRTSADHDINAAARTDFAHSPAFTSGTGDLITTANQIADKYKPALEELAGQKVSAPQKRFESARSAVLQSQKEQQEWDRIHYLRSTKVNPNNALVVQRKQDLLDAAKKAGVDMGPAPKDKAEGATFIGKDGKACMVVSGRTIPL